ncbi:MAG: hypothetical protein ACYCYE_09405 [Clostridia bacterium]
MKRGVFMGIPQIPHKCREEVINDILESIALEETAIAHIINAEGEKLQKLLECPFPHPISFDQILDLQKSVIEVFDKLIQKQNILLNKMKILKDFMYNSDDDNNCKPKCDDED